MSNTPVEKPNNFERGFVKQNVKNGCVVVSIASPNLPLMQKLLEKKIVNQGFSRGDAMHYPLTGNGWKIVGNKN
jgi:hypothetical protein